MQVKTEVYAAVAAAALSALTLLGARAGCNMGVMHHPARSVVVTTTQLPEVAIISLASSRSSDTADRAGAGLDTGMPYYSFAQRSIRL